MSSSPSPQHDRIYAQQRAHEPSMEEILASIRRIIADDAAPVAAQESPVVETQRPEPAFRSAAVRESAFREAAPARPAPLAPDRPANVEVQSFAAARVEAPRADAFEALTARLGAGLSEPAAAPERGFDIETAIVAAASEDLIGRAEAKPQPATVFTPATAAAPPVEAQPILSREADAAVAAQFGKLADSLMANNAQRLDEMTRQMLRPLLKSWLDDNLPVLVERLVRAEIERVARGGR